MKITTLLLGLLMMNLAFAREVEVGNCVVTANGVELKERMHMWQIENVVAPIILSVPDASGTMRKFRIIYDYTYGTHEINIKFMDCNRLYQSIRTGMKVCSHVFSTRQKANFNQPFELKFGGKLSNEPEIKMNCLRNKE